MRICRASIPLALVMTALSVSLPRAAAGAGEEGQLRATIEHLLEFVRTSDVVFIRNNKEHEPAEAADHIRKKYDHYRKRIETPEDFIRLSATKSMLSGKPYTVRLSDGTVITTKEWLESELARYRASRAGAVDSTGDTTRCLPDSTGR